MKIYHVNKKAPVARPGKKYIDHERYWGSIVKFSDTNTWYNYAILFSPDGVKRHELTQPTYEQFAKDAEHIYEGISMAEWRHFYGLVEQATRKELIGMKTTVDMKMAEHAQEWPQHYVKCGDKYVKMED